MQEELVSALADVNSLRSDMIKSQESTRQPFVPSEDERDSVRRFLFNLQRSGMTNMIAADEYIQKRFGFTKSKSEDYLFDYIENYSEIEDLYKPRADVSESSSVSTNGTKKRKGPKPYAEMTPEELAEAKAKAQARSKPKVEEPKVEEPVVATDVSLQKRTVIRLKKSEPGQEPKPKGVLIWNAFVNTVKVEMMQGGNGEEPSYSAVVKKAQELKEADPTSYKLFTENWAT